MQIAHNVVIGRHCVIVSGVGISGSTTLEDYVVLGGQVGVVGHLRIGEGSQIAGSSNVNRDVPRAAAGAARGEAVRAWFRELTTLARLAERSGGMDRAGVGLIAGRWPTEEVGLRAQFSARLAIALILWPSC